MGERLVLYLVERIVHWYQRRCTHPPDECFADLCQADAVWGHNHEPYRLPWCIRCGAVMRFGPKDSDDDGLRGMDDQSNWEHPDATWRRSP